LLTVEKLSEISARDPSKLDQDNMALVEDYFKNNTTRKSHPAM